MQCQKCGKKLKPGETFCSICGYYNSEDDIKASDNESSENWDDISSDIEIEIDDDDDSEKWFDDDITVIEEDSSEKKAAKKESFWSKKKEEQAEKKAKREKEKAEKEAKEKIEKAEREAKLEKEKAEQAEKKAKEEQEKQIKQEQREKELAERKEKLEQERQEQEYKKALEKNAKKESYGSYDDLDTASDGYEYENLLKAYIGEDYEKIRFKNFNLLACLLNWAYVIYRKLYITGIIGLLLTLLVILKFPGLAIIYIILVMVGIGFGFNKYYIFISKQVIKNQQKKFEGTDDYSMEKILSRKGGVNVLMALTLYLIFLIVLFYCMFHFKINKTHNTKFWEENTNNEASCISLTKIAYRDLPNVTEKGQIMESTCKVTTGTDNNEYSIYIKILENNKVIYAYYQTEKSYLKYRGNTQLLGELEQKQTNNTLSDVEKGMLVELKNIELTYNDIYEKSKEEKKLIEEKKNTKPRTDYFFTKEEITR